MEIIPVIDLMRGIVVQARAGNRTQYQPIQSLISKSVQPIQLIEDLLDFFPFQKLYIADLDAIMYGKKAIDLYQKLSSTFPQLEIWLDSGVRFEKEVAEILALANIHCIIASETVQDLNSVLDAVFPDEKLILSLDYQQGKLLGGSEILSTIQRWPSRIIAMNLDCVGSDSGPDYFLINQLQAKGDFEVIAAGGVRNEKDLYCLYEAGVHHVLIASALHTGKVTSKMIRDYLNL